MVKRPPHIDSIIYKAATQIAIEKGENFHTILSQLQQEYDSRGLIKLDALIRKLRTE